MEMKTYMLDRISGLIAAQILLYYSFQWRRFLRAEVIMYDGPQCSLHILKGWQFIFWPQKITRKTSDLLI